MASAAEFLARSHGVSLCRSHTILIDDDMDNIEVALQNSVRAVQCDPMNPMRLITELKNLS